MKTLTIELSDVTAKIVADLLQYNLSQLEMAEKADPFKDNGYLKKACNETIEAIHAARNSGE
jgi:hypothetical protein